MTYADAAVTSENEVHYRDIVEGSLHGIIIQQDERIVYANPAMARLFGYAAPHEMIGLNPFEELIDERDLSEFRARTAAVYRNEKVSPHPGWKARRPDGVWAWMTSTAHRTMWQGRPAVASFYSDITERKQSELALRESEARYRAALTAGRMGAWETDLIAKTRIWTPEGMELFGLSLPGGVGHVGGESDEYRSAIHPEDRKLVSRFYEQAEKMDTFSAEYRIVRPNGEQLWLSGSGQVISRLPDGRAERLISVMVDVTERKALEAREQMLKRELAHRSANLMTVVQSVARQIGRTARSFEKFQAEFQGRLQSLAYSQEALLMEGGSGASLRDLVRRQLHPFVEESSPCLEITGQEVRLSPQAAHTLGLAVHELATNALKHGAWSIPNGRVLVSWTARSDENDISRLVLMWTEESMSPAKFSSRKGFGSTVLYELIPKSLNGDARGDFGESGFSWTLSAPMSALSAVSRE